MFTFSSITTCCPSFALCGMFDKLKSPFIFEYSLQVFYKLLSSQANRMLLVNKMVSLLSNLLPLCPILYIISRFFFKVIFINRYEMISRYKTKILQFTESRSKQECLAS